MPLALQTYAAHCLILIVSFEYTDPVIILPWTRNDLLDSMKNRFALKEMMKWWQVVFKYSSINLQLFKCLY